MRRVVGRDGRSWLVRQRWIPHRGGIGARARFSRARMRRRADGLSEGTDLSLDGCVEELAIGVVIVVGVVAAVMFGWPLLLLLVDLIWLLVAVAIGLVARVLFRRPWRVEAVASGGARHTWSTVGFRAAGRLRDELVATVANGGDPASTSFVSSAIVTTHDRPVD